MIKENHVLKILEAEQARLHHEIYLMSFSKDRTYFQALIAEFKDLIEEIDKAKQSLLAKVWFVPEEEEGDLH